MAEHVYRCFSGGGLLEELGLGWEDDMEMGRQEDDALLFILKYGRWDTREVVGS